MTIDPKTGTTTSRTTVKVKNNASGSITGIDSNDTVDVANGAAVNISGTGGTVDLSAGGSSGTITNTAGAGGADITVEIGGDTISVPPGSTISF